MMSIPSHIWPMSSPESSTVIRTAKSISSCRGLTESKTSRQWPENDAYRTPNNSGPPLQQAPLLDKTGTALEDLPVSVQIIKCEVVTEQAGTLPNELTNRLTTCSVRIVLSTYASIHFDMRRQRSSYVVRMVVHCEHPCRR
jgi:hypothetical protein